MDRNTFSQLPSATQAALLACGIQQSVPKGTELFAELEDVEDLYFLLDGYTALHRSSFHGEDRIVFICAAGEILNEISLENGKPAIAARTLSPATLLRVPRAEVEHLIQQDPLLAQAIFRSLARKSHRLYHKVGNATGTYALKNRMAATIWKLARDYGVDTPDGRRINFEVTVNLLADFMGAKRESVSRALSEMKREDLLTHKNGTMTVTDLQRMRQYIRD